MPTVTVRLNDEQVDRIKQSGQSYSDAVRNALDSTALVKAEIPQPSTGAADISEFKYVNAADTPESKAMTRLETAMAIYQAGIQLDSVALLDAQPLTLGDQLMDYMLAQENKKRAHLTLEASRDMTVGVTTTNNPVSIDPSMRAMMQLSEYYTITEGDLWQAILFPLEVGLQDFDFPSGDEGARRAARQLLEDQIDAHQLLEELWVARQTHGQAYALDLSSGKNLEGIVVPNSKHIAVGRATGLGKNQFAYVPTNLQTARSLVDTQPSFLLDSQGWEWNEEQIEIHGLPLDPQSVTMFKVPKFAHAFYAIPPLARASRAIDTRRFLEEMQRATIEGIKNQLWVFTLENPLPGEPTALAAQLSGSRGARTGYLVWRSGLDVKQFIPENIDNLLAPEATWNYTMKVYRDLGINVRMISGENPSRGSTSNSEVDVEVSLDRLMYSRRPFQTYLQGLVNKYIGVDKSGDPRATVRMADVDLKIVSRIKNYLTPLMNFGLPSPTTAFTIAGLDRDQEMKQHARDADEREKYIKPYSGFAQDGPTGTALQSEKGRPPGKTEMQPRQQKAEANVLEAADQSTYADAVMTAWAGLIEAFAQGADVNTKKAAVTAFVAAMMTAAETYRPIAYQRGFMEAGGHGETEPDDVQKWALWDLPYLNDFAGALDARAATGEDISGFETRAMMYASEGWRLAYVAGLFAARKKQGFVAWRRLLRPYASKSGPCPTCIADANVIHSITEPFWEPHPLGACGTIFLAFYVNKEAVGAVVKIPPAEPL